MPPLPNITNLYSKELDDLPELGGREGRPVHDGDSLPDLYIQREDAVESLLDTDDQSNNENSLLAAKTNLVRSRTMVEYSGKHLEKDRMKFKQKKQKRMSVDMMRSKSNAILGELFAVNQSSDSDCIYLGHDSPVKLLQGSEADSCDSDVPVRRCVKKPKCITTSEDSELSDICSYSNKVSYDFSSEETQLKNYSQKQKVLKESKEKRCHLAKKVIPPDRQSENVQKLDKEKVNSKTHQHQADSLKDSAAERDTESTREKPPSATVKNSCYFGSLNSRSHGVFDFLNSLKLPSADRNTAKRLKSKCYVLLKDCTLDQGDKSMKCLDGDRHFMDVIPREMKEPDNQDSPNAADKSLNYSLKSSEFSDVSDTDDDMSEEVPSQSAPNKEMVRYQRLLSAYSDISEDSGTETNDNGLNPFTHTSQILNSSLSTTFVTMQISEPKHLAFLRHDLSNEYSDISDFEDNKINNDLTEKEVQLALGSHCDITETLQDSLNSQVFQNQTENTGHNFIASEQSLSGMVEQENYHPVHTIENGRETDENELMEEISDNESSCTRNYSKDSCNAEMEKFLDDVCSMISTPDSSDYSDSDDDEILDRKDKRSTGYHSNFTGTDYKSNTDITEIFHESHTSEEETMFYCDSVPVTQQDLPFGDKIVCTDNCGKFTSENGRNNEDERSEVHKVSSIKDLYKFDTDLPDLNLTQTYTCNSEDYDAEIMQMSHDMLDRSDNTSMPYLSAVSPLPYNYTSDSAAESHSMVVNTHSSLKYSIQDMPVLSPIKVYTNTSEHLPSQVRPYGRKRKVRCRKTESNDKQSYSCKPKRYVSSGKTDPGKQSQVINSETIRNQLCHHVKNFCCLSENQSPQCLLPCTQMNILDECRVDGCHNFSHFFYFLSHFSSNYIIPSKVHDFIYKNILFESDASQNVINCAQYILTKLTSSHSLTFEITWLEVETCIQGMMNSDLSVKTAEEILQNEVFLELVLSVLKIDLFSRNLTVQKEIQGSKVYKLLSLDVTSLHLKKVISFVREVLHTVNDVTTNGLSSYKIKLLNILQVRVGSVFTNHFMFCVIV